MQSARRRSIVLICGVATLALMSTSTNIALADEPTNELSSLSEMTAAVPGNPANVGDNYYLIQTELFFEHPDSWGGAFVDGDDLVVNYVDQTESEALAALERIGVDTSVAIRVQSVEASMSSLQEQVGAISDGVTARGIDGVTSVGPQYSESRVVVGAEQDSAALNDLVVEVTGEGAVTYEHDGAQATSRWYWDSPVRGGAFYATWSLFEAEITRTCSTGFVWDSPNSTNDEVVTASHCLFPIEEPRILLDTLFSVPTGSAFQQFGSEVWTSGTSAGTEPGLHGDVAVAEIIPTVDAVGEVYAGDGDTTNTMSVVGHQSLPEGWQGDNLRTSGASGYDEQDPDLGEIAPDWVSLVDQTIRYPTGEVFHTLSFAEHVSDCTAPGDSGGAYYTTSIVEGDVLAVGIVSGSNGQGAGPTNCRNYFTPISYVVADYGGTTI